MQRISSNMTNNDLNSTLRSQEYQINRNQNQMASQQRIQNLRDDPVAAAHATRYQSWMARLERYDSNALEVQANLRIQESHLSQTQDILQRVNELTIQGANGTYSKSDLQTMGNEINEYLNELVSIGNAKGPDGQSLFAGTKLDSAAFRTLKGHVEGGTGQVITNVEYMGSIGENKADISENTSIATNFAGNKVFWADQQKVYSSVDAQNYQVQSDTSFLMDGKKIDLKAGDNIHTIVSRINAAPVAVRASIDPVTNGLVLETTQPHQLFLEDAAGTGGNVLRDLGVLSDRPGLQPPQNLHPDARAFGGSMFDAVIRLRDNLLAGNKEFIGGQGLAGVQASLKNIQTAVAELGSRDTRLEDTSKRLQDEIPKVQEKTSNLLDLDLTQGITQMKMLDYTHQAALKAAAKILPTTLMDFLR
ncbi:MAG: flagellar hook-associated protein 3 [Spirochaetales bacterium]